MIPRGVSCFLFGTNSSIHTRCGVNCEHCSQLWWLCSLFLASSRCMFFPRSVEWPIVGYAMVVLFLISVVLHSQFAHEFIPIVGRQLCYRCGAAHGLVGGVFLTPQKLVVISHSRRTLGRGFVSCGFQPPAEQVIRHNITYQRECICQVTLKFVDPFE